MSYLNVNGNFQDVLTRLDQQAGHVFGARAGKFMSNISEQIVSSARSHGWDTVNVTISDGLAQRQIDEYMRLEEKGFVQGPVFVDPTASTPQSQRFDSPTAMKAARERIIRMNEASGDVMYVIHGMDKIDPSLSNRIDAANSNLSNGDLERLARQSGDAEPEFTKDQNSEQVLEDRLVSGSLRERAAARSSGVQSILVNTASLAAQNNDSATQAAALNMQAQVSSMPAKDAANGATTPIEQRAIQMQDKQEAKIERRPGRPEEPAANNPEGQPLPPPAMKPE